MAVSEVVFSELLSAVIDNRGKTCPTSDAGIPLIATNCIRNELLYPTYEKARFVSQETYLNWFRGHPMPGDILFVNKATPGRVCLVPNPVDFCIAQDMVALRAESTKIYPRYLFAALRSPSVQERIATMHVGTLIPHFKKGDFDKLTIPVPERKVQEFIGDTYFSLSAKIDVNRRMSETLEAMARALFRSWFVDFDPVRAKSEGRDPGLPKHVADLFPDSFEDSELGEIPRGWGVGALGDFLCQRVERCFRSQETAARPYVPIDCISPKSLSLAASKPGDEAQTSLTKFYQGDILFGAMRPYFHKICIAPFDGTTRTTAFVLHPGSINDFAFATFQLHHPDTVDFATRHSTGSTIPYAVWTDSMETMPIVAPPDNVREEFNRLLLPLLVRLQEPYFANRSLAALRDTLLPKLISGDLRVKDADKFLERVHA